MSRRLSRSFFWIDQQLIRGGHWSRINAASRLLYVALAASCDRQGVSLCSCGKLMELSAIRDHATIQESLVALESMRLIEVRSEQIPPAIVLLPLDAAGDVPGRTRADPCEGPRRKPALPGPPRTIAPSDFAEVGTPACPAASVVVHTHTHTIVRLGSAGSAERILPHADA